VTDLLRMAEPFGLKSPPLMLSCEGPLACAKAEHGKEKLPQIKAISKALNITMALLRKHISTYVP
jgi:hypothetical protein